MLPKPVEGFRGTKVLHQLALVIFMLVLAAKKSLSVRHGKHAKVARGQEPVQCTPDSGKHPMMPIVENEKPGLCQIALRAFQNIKDGALGVITINVNNVKLLRPNCT